MSAEGLVSEVRTSVLYRPVLEAAEGVAYHDRRALSDVKPESSHGGQAQQNKGGKGHGKGDKVIAAINDAKQTLHKANKGGRNHRNSHKSESEDYSQLKKELDELKIGYNTLKSELEDLKKLVKGGSSASAPAPQAAAPAEKKADADEDFDLFGSDESDDEEKKRITEERLKAYAAKKSKKPGPIAKSNIIYDIKPWDDTIDIAEIEKAVRGIEMDGLIWGASKKLPVAFGINKLQITCVVEDEKVSTDSLEEEIMNFEDLVQSVDVVAFNKV